MVSRNKLMRLLLNYVKVNSLKGFTLIEILLAVSVLTLGAMFLIKGLTISTTADADIENKVIALNLVVEKVEELNNLPFNHADLSSGVTHIEDDQETDLGFDDTDSRNWTREWIVSSYQGSDTDELKSIRVIVSWTPKGEATRLNVEAETLMVNLTWAGS